ncbi:DNA binding protein, excisionase family [gamma proteobacterium BDW918]|nr:DNA binding protein, excisionase family [gamma proteobacterium BDW918]
MKTLDLKEAAAFLKMSPSALRKKARSGRIRGAKPAKQWVFLEEDLVWHLRSLYSGLGQTPLSGCEQEDSQCHFINGERSGGSSSLAPVASSYAALLGLRTKSRLKNTTTD